jgi:hypothetical protein
MALSGVLLLLIFAVSGPATDPDGIRVQLVLWRLHDASKKTFLLKFWVLIAIMEASF